MPEVCVVLKWIYLHAYIYIALLAHGFIFLWDQRKTFRQQIEVCPHIIQFTSNWDLCDLITIYMEVTETMNTVLL